MEGNVAAFWSGFIKGLSANSAVYTAEYVRERGTFLPEGDSRTTDIDVVERQRALVQNAGRRFNRAVRSAFATLDNR
jgi:hypothetical protein